MITERMRVARGVGVAVVGACLLSACGPPGSAGWPLARGPGSTQYSSLDQITRENVAQLETAWVYRTGDAEPGRSQVQATPIVIEGVLYATSPGLQAFALDAATGRELWTFDPFDGNFSMFGLGVSRGVTYWADGDDRRILMSAGPRLYALDAGSGVPIDTFGDGGSVDLRAGLDRAVDDLYISSNTPGAIFEDLLILPTRVSESEPAAPGHIRAFDVRTGERAWIFHTIPHPGEFGYDTWPEDAWTRVGGANNWSGVTVDEARGLVFVPTGSAAPDFYGGVRAGANLFANTLLALDARTGERVWHYQFVHHDLWDRDLPAPPNLLTLEHDGRRIDAVAQITKSGHVFVFDRDTGAPLFPITERPVPASDLPGEIAWDTQPLPSKPPPFARQTFEPDDVSDISPEVHASLLARLERVRSGGQFVPPSREGTIILPGYDGGGEWGGAAVDPDGIMYVNASEMPWILTMIDVDADGEATPGELVYANECLYCHGVDRQGDQLGVYPALTDLPARLSRTTVEDVVRAGTGAMPSHEHLSDDEVTALLDHLFDVEAQTETQTARDANERSPSFTSTGYIRFLDPDGHPAIKPPWGTLNAINLNTGEIDWTVTLGEFPELTALGLPPTGTENYGGPIVTAGGVLFIAATQDEKFRAFDTRTGAALWESQLPAGGYATPATYTVDGRQFVVIAAGGGKMGTKSGDAYVAFALPR